MSVKKAKKSKTKSARKTVSPRKKTVKKKAVRKKTRSAVRKKSATAKRKTARKSVKKGAAKRRTASSAKRTVRKKTARKKLVRKKVAQKVTKSAAKKKKVAKTAKRKPAPKKKTAAKKKTALKPRRAATKPRKQPRKKPGARMLKPKEENASLRPSKAYQIKKGEPYMNSQQLEHFSKMLLDWKKELMKEVDRTVDHMKSGATNFADPADRATQEEEFSLELRTRDRERKLIKKIDEALGMMDMDEYGYCSSCGAEIGVRRLEARPTATLCIDCKTMQEIKEKQIAD